MKVSELITARATVRVKKMLELEPSLGGVERAHALTLVCAAAIEELCIYLDELVSRGAISRPGDEFDRIDPTAAPSNRPIGEDPK